MRRLGRFVGKIVFYCIMFGVVGAVLSKLGAPLGGLAAMLAAAGFAVGLAFQGTLSNFASGVLMLVFRPFKVGDVINAGGVTGKVNEIDLFTTTLDTPDNRRIIVPNSAISGRHDREHHLSPPPSHRGCRGCGLQRGHGPNPCGARIGRWRRSPPRPSMAKAAVQPSFSAALGDCAVEWKVRMWVSADNYWSMLESLTGEVKRRLDSVNIGIPFPQLDVHLSRFDGGDDEPRQRPRVRPVRREAEETYSESAMVRAS